MYYYYGDNFQINCMNWVSPKTKSLTEEQSSFGDDEKSFTEKLGNFL